MESVLKGSLTLCSIDATKSNQWLLEAPLYYTGCSHLKNKEQSKELKGRRGKIGLRDRHEKKKFKIVVEELAIMNSFLIPLRHVLVEIPWVRLILPPLLRSTNPVLLWYFETRFICKKILAWWLNAYHFTLGTL